MKKLILLLFLFSIVFPYTAPPLDEVLESNKNISPSLFYSEHLGSSPEEFVSYSYNVKLLSLSPSIDNRISSSRDTFLFWTAYFSFYDFDSGNCGGKQFYNQSFSYTLNFTFRNFSKIISNTVDSASQLSYLEIPFSYEELNNTQADDLLNVKLDWRSDVYYLEGSLVDAGKVQYCEYEYVNYPSSGTDNLEYFVDGGEVVFLLTKPVLKEQWYKNNHFDFLILSNRKIYYSNIKKNSQIISTFNLYDFNITEDDFGIRSINSVEIPQDNSNSAEYNTYISPLLLWEGNSSFSLIYKFNSTYGGLGENKLSVAVKSFFGQEFSFSENITSKMLTYSGNISEEGDEVDADKKEYWESLGYGNNQLVHILIPASALSLLILIVLYRFK